MKKSLAVALASALVTGCAAPEPASQGTEFLRPEIVAVHPFDSSSFTQGLEVDGDTLLVGTGKRGESRLYRSTLDGVELAGVELEETYFGEGLTRTPDHVWQLTWQAGTAFKRDPATLETIDEVHYDGEGWGLCAFDDELIFSDGTSQLRRMDPETMEERERFTVTMDGQPVPRLNELECVSGANGPEVYANIFLNTDIMRIDPTTGDVTAVIDASSLPNNAVPDPDHVLNGIAHIPETDRFFLTGKRWPDLYEVRFVGAD